MRHLLLIPIVLGILFAPSTSRAQNGADIVRGFIGFAAGEIERHERRKQQKRARRRQHQQFKAAWHACFQNDVAACNQALTYQHIHRNDRSRLEDKRSRLLAAQQQEAERIRYDELMRERAQREAAERRLAQERAEAERLRRVREQEEQRLAKLRAFTQDRSACRGHDVSACERALGSSLAGTQDVVELRRTLNIVKSYQQNRSACEAGTRSACTAALASPALADTDRALLERWHADAHPFNQAMASMGDLPTSTVIIGTLALLLSIALYFIAFKRRATDASIGEGDATEPANTVRQRFAGFANDCAARWRPSSNAHSDREIPDLPVEPMLAAKPVPPLVRDTPGAIAALELAEAYIEEVREAERPAFDDKVTRRAQLNTLSLAAKQLTLAEELDPDAELVIADDKGELAFTIGALKAKALILEARCYDDHNPKRALPPLRQATEVDPSNATAHYLLGCIEAANMNRARAVEALQVAVELEPDNLTYRKELNRAESISGAEAAAFKATRMGERAYDTGISAWNIFAVVWNIITFPYRVMFNLMRLISRFT